MSAGLADATVVAAGRDEMVTAIGSPVCAVALWRRAVPDAVGAGLALVDPATVDDWEAVVPARDAAVYLAAELAGAGYPGEAAVALALDVAPLVSSMAGLLGAPALHVRLDWVETDSCRRFHADLVTVRLLSTYAGRGTQWRGRGEADEAARAMAAGDVALFKGRRLLPDAPVLHRSPPIAGTGERRLLLVIDEPGASED